MTRFSSAFSRGPALVCFITGGDGDTAANLDALVEGGADVIELGMPFTDPMADGPAIQEANLRSLGKGTRTADIRSEEHTSELQSLMRISYAVFCLKKKINTAKRRQITTPTH